MCWAIVFYPIKLSQKDDQKNGNWLGGLKAHLCDN